MKSSIKGIFNNIIFFLSLLTIVSVIAVLFTIDQNNSFKKVDILNEEKNLIKELHQIDKEDIEIALIQYNGKSTELNYQIQKLHQLYEYDLLGQYILHTSKEYLSQLDQLTQLINAYNAEALKYFKANEKDEKNLYKELQNSFVTINNHISNIIFQNINYNKAKQDFMYQLALAIFVFIFITSIVFYKKLSNIYKDIEFLQLPNADTQNHQLYTSEADAIYLRMKRKSTKNLDASCIDPVTNINNNKGLVNSYADKKSLKESGFTAVAVLEVDTFSKTKRTFPQDFIQMTLKKIATTISMYEQPADVIGRTDYNEFTVILSRNSKQRAFKEIDQMRQSIEELKLVTATKVPVGITISGGFYIKPNNVSLNNALLETKSILEFAKQNGGNKISQKKDITGVKI